MKLSKIDLIVTLSIKTFSIMTLSIIDLIVTLNIKDILHNDIQHNRLNCDTA